MIDALMKYNDLLAWVIPGGIVLAATILQWIYGWRRLLDQVNTALAHKADRTELVQATLLKMEAQACMTARRECVNSILEVMERNREAADRGIARVEDDLQPLWKAHNGLAKEYAASSAKIDEAVTTLKAAVKEMRDHNGRRVGER